MDKAMKVSPKKAAVIEDERQVTSLLSDHMTFYSFFGYTTTTKKMLCTSGPFNLGLLSPHLIICSLWLLMPTIEPKHFPGMSKPLSAVSPSLLLFSPRCRSCHFPCTNLYQGLST